MVSPAAVGRIGGSGLDVLQCGLCAVALGGEAGFAYWRVGAAQSYKVKRDWWQSLASVGLFGGNCNYTSSCGVYCNTLSSSAIWATWRNGAAQPYRVKGIDGRAYHCRPVWRERQGKLVAQFMRRSRCYIHNGRALARLARWGCPILQMKGINSKSYRCRPGWL